MKVHSKLKWLEKVAPEYPMPEFRYEKPQDPRQACGFYQHPNREHPTGCIIVVEYAPRLPEVERVVIAHEFAHHIQYYDGLRTSNDIQYWILDQYSSGKLTWEEMNALYFQVPKERKAELFAWMMTGDILPWNRLTQSGLKLPKRVPKNGKAFKRLKRMISDSL